MINDELRHVPVHLLSLSEDFTRRTRMYVVLLRFSTNKAKAPDHMAAHRTWIQRGVDDGVFILVGSIR